jgi:hypothetical protein
VTARSDRLLDLTAHRSRLVFTKTLLLTAVLFVLPAMLSASVSVMSSDENGVSFRYTPGEIRLTNAVDGRQAMDFDDADHFAQPGEPDLPGRVLRIGIPQAGGVRVSVRTGPERKLQAVQLSTVPHMSWDGDSSWYDELPTKAGVLLQEPADVGPAEVLRRTRFVTLRLSPCRYDTETGTLSYYEWLDVSVAFEQDPQRNGDSDPLDGAVASMLLNGQTALDWKLDWPDGTASQLASAAPVGQFDRSPNWLRIWVDSTGIYGVTGRELAAAGLSLSGLDPTTLALYTVGEHEPSISYPDSMRQVPVFVQDGGDGKLDPTDRVVFYGLGPGRWVGRCSAYIKNYFTRHNVYWLTWGGAQGSRMPSGSQPDTTNTPVVYVGRDRLHQERDLDCPARSGLLWIWALLFKAADREVAMLDVPLDVEYPVQVGRLAGRFMAVAGGNRLSVLLNRRPVATYEFDQSPPSSPLDFAVDTTLPVNFGRNVLTFELRGVGQKSIYLDYLEVDYLRRLSLYRGQLHFLQDDTGRFRFCIKDVRERPVVLDVTDPYRPAMSNSIEWSGDSARFCLSLDRPAEIVVSGASQFLVPAGIELRRPGQLRGPGRQADYWVVTPKEFLGPAQQMARYRTGRVAGISQAVALAASLDDIYDDYAFGMEEPGAIKRFLADKHPAYGLLAGDATCDYKGILGKRPPGVPTYEYGFGLNPDAYDRSALAFDAWYADFDGEGGSPDMALGRVTCRSAVELRQFVDKVIAYETQPAGLWNKRYLLLADDEFLGEANPNNPSRWDPLGFGHITYCEAVSQIPDSRLDLAKVYLTEWPYVGIKNKPGAQAELMRQVNLGGVVLVFFGHGAGFDLTHESVLNIAQVPQIRNGHRSPFCYFGSCSVGRFDDTQYECIAEELVRQPSGAIASVGATKATVAGSNLVFARKLLTPLFAQPDSTIGSSFFQAWPNDKIYHLFGDPATVLRLPRASKHELTVTPDTLRPGGRFSIIGMIEAARAKFAWLLQGPARIRGYRSFRGETSYQLPGLDLARGTGDVTEGMMRCQGTFPLGVPLDTVFVPNGNYAPIVRSCRFSASAWGDSGDLGVLRDSLEYARTPAAVADTAGPAVSLYRNGNRLESGAAVPSEFELEGVATDSSGIMIAPVAGAVPSFFVNSPNYSTDLSDLLLFDNSSSTTARFRMPVKLSGPVDSLFVMVSDNLLNRTVAGISVTPLLSDVLRVESVLPYPNPARTGCRFTFMLSRQAEVRVRIYSLAGRLVRDLGFRPADFGYNDVEWDGRDSDGNQPANGVYLFALTAQVDEGPGRRQRVTVRDKLLVLR